MKKKFILWSCLAIITILTGIIGELPFWLVPFKYISLALLIFVSTERMLSFFAMPVLHSSNAALFCQGCSLVLMLLYMVLTMDTFIFHAWTWFPGLLRYPIYDAYGFCYLIFTLPAFLWHLGKGEKINA